MRNLRIVELLQELERFRIRSFQLLQLGTLGGEYGVLFKQLEYARADRRDCCLLSG